MQKRTKRQLSTLGLAAALVLGAGLATALTLPDQASDQAKQQVADVVLPDQATGPGATAGDESLISDAASEHGKAVSEAAHDDSTKGCEHGRAVSELASSKAADTRQNEGDHPGPCGPNDGQGAGGASAAAHAAKGTHGQSSSTHGQSSSANGKSSSSHGKSAEDHGKDDLPHGLGAGSAPDDLPTNNQ